MGDPTYEVRPLDEQTANALAAAERAFRLEVAHITRTALVLNGLTAAEGWRVNLGPGAPQGFVREVANG